MIKVEIQFKSMKYESFFTESTKIIEIKKQIEWNSGMQIEYQKYECTSKNNIKYVLKNEKSLSEYFALHLNEKLTVKCHYEGSGIDYEKYNFIEQFLPVFGNFLILFLNFKNVNFGKIQLFFCVFFHFLKKQLEIKHVYFERKTHISKFVFVQNCVFYGIIIGIIMPFEFIYFQNSELNSFHETLMGLFFIFEYHLYWCNLKIRKLKMDQLQNDLFKSTSFNTIHNELFFDCIVSPNYTFEICVWITISVLTSSLSGLLFTIGQVYIFAKSARLKKINLLSGNLSAVEAKFIEKKYLIFPFIL